ncbi:uncharacterized protein LOC108680387 [Hyalella azteca]|uniref:Uncharacterized protein LOC108680387 n=1 Tax=Hyalella azteca TaxID=294128 RepID=A0A8B7PFA9_HYAAZ|nr:uncharacterized protein LOC108680387 [Hyalella azteca]
MYASYSPEPGCGFVCRPSGLESNLPAPPITCCDSSKSATTAGCLKDLAANYSFVGAKTACRALGMDLFAPLVYTDFTALLAETSVQSRGAFFIGYVNRSGSWAWKSTIFRTGTIQVAVAAADWNATYPDPDMYWMCAVVVNQKIQNSLCATGINAVCHAPVPIC